MLLCVCCRHDTRSSTCNNMHWQRTYARIPCYVRSGHLIRPSWSRYQFYILAVPLATLASDVFFTFVLFVVIALRSFFTQMGFHLTCIRMLLIIARQLWVFNSRRTQATQPDQLIVFQVAGIMCAVPTHTHNHTASQILAERFKSQFNKFRSMGSFYSPSSMLLLECVLWGHALICKKLPFPAHGAKENPPQRNFIYI